MTRTATILLVEDETDLREITGNLLRRKGYEVLSASSARDAMMLAEINPQAVDLVLTDIVMLPTSGPEMIEEMLERGINPKVLYFSGYPLEKLIAYGADPNTVPFLSKPFTAQQLLDKVQDILSGKQ